MSKVSSNSDRFVQGFFKPKHPQKYKGDVSKIIYRSSWELKFMFWCDSRSNVIQWSSEETIIPYKSPLDRRYHRYFVDFWVKIRERDTGNICIYLIEIKPLKQTQQPVRKKRVTKSFIYEAKQYAINTSKWKAAEEFCKDRGWKFKILTEKELGIG